MASKYCLSDIPRQAAWHPSIALGALYLKLRGFVVVP